MKYRPTAVGYLRSDVSGVQQAWDETQIRSLAGRLGYDFARMVVIDGRTATRLLAGVKATIARLDAEAVFVPCLAHFEGENVPADLVQAVDVITVSPENTHARWSTGLVESERGGGGSTA
ncbi:hypothetical protein ACFXHA_40880 [Nocardia sp. NPDC059240]|uniref:hypothetical protein n=1 Tax=Nocardia sp. NPDC059240 TaxID=3346786 RepID=UPI0036B8CC35